MRCVSVTVLLCLATMLLAQVTCQISGRSNCLCLKTLNRVPRKENIESYMIQKAGIFKGCFICTDPQSSLAINSMQYVKIKAFEKTAFLINPTSTFKRGSTLIKTSDWNGEDELRTILPELLQFVNTSLYLFIYCTWSVYSYFS
uniref:Uncharacterized protein n=1 Tax=Cyprinus carpio TaxID=7962 RepID=A0A8C1WXY2_CYPCA